MYLLTITHDCTVNIALNHCHIYNKVRAGQQLGYGQKQLMEQLQQAYFKHGYGTKLERIGQ